MQESSRSRRATRGSAENRQNKRSSKVHSTRSASVGEKTPETPKRKREDSHSRSPRKRNCRFEDTDAGTWRTIIPKKIIGRRVVDPYCFTCHQPTEETRCNLCGRSYHNKCLKKFKTGLSKNVSCECEFTSVNRRRVASWDIIFLKRLLKLAIGEASRDQKKKNNKGRSKIHTLLTGTECPSLHSLCDVLDIEVLLERVSVGDYATTNECFMDVKRIHHNNHILYGPNHEITTAAQKFEKNMKYELEDMEACRDCYDQKVSSDCPSEDFFTNICGNPHPVVWAKLKGSPYWPAKCLEIFNGHADVRFFGTHDKAILSLDQVCKISKTNPGKVTKSSKYIDALTELSVYIVQYEAKGPSFEYCEGKIPLVEPITTSRKGYSKRGRGKNTLDESIDDVVAESSTEPVANPCINVAVLHEDVVESKAAVVRLTDCIFQHPGLDNADSVSSQIKPKPIYNDGFVENDDSANEMNISDNFVELTSTPQCALPESQSSLVSLNSSLDASSTNELVNHIETTEANSNDFINANDSNNLPVITSTMSSFETPSTLSSFNTSALDESTSEVNKILNTICNSKSSASAEDFFTKQNFDINRIVNMCPPSEIITCMDHEDEDEVQVVNEVSKSSALTNWAENNKFLSKTLTEVLLGNRPGIRKYLEVFQKLTMQQFTLMFLECNGSRLNASEGENFKDIYKSFLNKIGSLQLAKDQLEKRFQELSNTLSELQAKDDTRDLIQNELIGAQRRKSAKEQEALKLRIDKLEEKLKELKESNEVKTKQNAKIYQELKEAEQDQIRIAEEWEQYKNDQDDLRKKYNLLKEELEQCGSDKSNLEKELEQYKSKEKDLSGTSDEKEKQNFILKEENVKSNHDVECQTDDLYTESSYSGHVGSSSSGLYDIQTKKIVLINQTPSTSDFGDGMSEVNNYMMSTELFTSGVMMSNPSQLMSQNSTQIMSSNSTMLSNPGQMIPSDLTLYQIPMVQLPVMAPPSSYAAESCSYASSSSKKESTKTAGSSSKSSSAKKRSSKNIMKKH